MSSSTPIATRTPNKITLSFNRVSNLSISPMENLTLTALLKQVAAKYPDRRAISLSGQFDITHARLDQLIERAASLLVSADVKPADVVALTFPNTVEVYLYNLFIYYTSK